MKTENKEVKVMPQEQAAKVFSEFDKQLQEWKEESKNVVFDISTKQGNKEARSFVAKIRKSKKPVADAHKAAKAESLEYGRMLDAEKNRIIATIDEVIDVYAVPLAELEAKEQARIDSIKQRVNDIEALSNAASVDFGSFTSAQLIDNMSKIKSIVIDDSFDEFKELAALTKDESMTKLDALIVDVSAQEECDAEFARLKAEEEKRQQEARENEIREQARKHAEEAHAAALKAEKEAAERRELELKLQAEKAEREKLEAVQRAEEDKKKAIEDERNRVEQLRITAEKEEQKKAANRNHQKKINNEALDCFNENGIDNGMEIIKLIALGKIKNVSINY